MPIIQEFPYHHVDLENFATAVRAVFGDMDAKFGLHKDSSSIGLISAKYRHVMLVKYRRKGFLIRGLRVRWLASLTGLLPGDPRDMGSAVSDNMNDVLRLIRDVMEGSCRAPYETISLAKEALKAMG